MPFTVPTGRLSSHIAEFESKYEQLMLTDARLTRISLDPESQPRSYIFAGYTHALENSPHQLLSLAIGVSKPMSMSVLLLLGNKLFPPEVL